MGVGYFDLAFNYFLSERIAVMEVSHALAHGRTSSIDRSKSVFCRMASCTYSAGRFMRENIFDDIRITGNRA